MVFLSIPFIGIFALHLIAGRILSPSGYVSFNSLYWDFCSASSSRFKYPPASLSPFNSLYWDFCSASINPPTTIALCLIDFQFPLLGFLLCIGWADDAHAGRRIRTFNSLYWDFCSASSSWIKHTWLASWTSFNSLYWDFCSASSLPSMWKSGFASAFNSLYWDFCSASRAFKEIHARNQDPFNSLYWDFCSASPWWVRVPFGSEVDFQFPLLGFLLCISAYTSSQPCFPSKLSIPFIGIFALHLEDYLDRACRHLVFQFPLLGFLLCICWHFLAGLPF